MIAQLPFGLKYELFYQAGRSLGVTSYQVAGEQGTFFGSLSDQSVIKPYLRHGKWSENLIELFEQFFARSDAGTFYDVGANIGLTLLPIAKNKSVRCIGFEPDPANFGLLSANIVGNSASQIEIRNVAVADRAGELRFTRNVFNSGDHRLSADGEIVVQTIALDDLPFPENPLAIKIDTQGAEPLIFAGGKRQLAAAGLIVCEFWPWGMKRMGNSPDRLLSFVEEFSGSCFVIKHEDDAHVPLTSGQALAELNKVIARGGEYDAVDLVLMKVS